MLFVVFGVRVCCDRVVLLWCLGFCYRYSVDEFRDGVWWCEVFFSVLVGQRSGLVRAGVRLWVGSGPGPGLVGSGCGSGWVGVGAWMEGVSSSGGVGVVSAEECGVGKEWRTRWSAKS